VPHLIAPLTSVSPVLDALDGSVCGTNEALSAPPVFSGLVFPCFRRHPTPNSSVVSLILSRLWGSTLRVDSLSPEPAPCAEASQSLWQPLSEDPFLFPLKSSKAAAGSPEPSCALYACRARTFSPQLGLFSNIPSPLFFLFFCRDKSWVLRVRGHYFFFSLFLSQIPRAAWIVVAWMGSLMRLFFTPVPSPSEAPIRGETLSPWIISPPALSSALDSARP